MLLLVHAKLNLGVGGKLLLGELVLGGHWLPELGQSVFLKGSSALGVYHFALFCKSAVEAHDAQIAIRV